MASRVFPLVAFFALAVACKGAESQTDTSAIATSTASSLVQQITSTPLAVRAAGWSQIKGWSFNQYYNYLLAQSSATTSDGVSMTQVQSQLLAVKDLFAQMSARYPSLGAMMAAVKLDPSTASANELTKLYASATRTTSGQNLGLVNTINPNWDKPGCADLLSNVQSGMAFSVSQLGAAIGEYYSKLGADISCFGSGSDTKVQIGNADAYIIPSSQAIPPGPAGICPSSFTAVNGKGGRTPALQAVVQGFMDAKNAGCWTNVVDKGDASPPTTQAAIPDLMSFD